MKKLVPVALIGACVLSLTAFTMPDDRIVEMWECTVKEGKTIEQVQATNSKWVKFMNGNVPGGDIRSYVLSPIVGERGEGVFMFVDSYPSLASWAAAKKAIETDAGKAVEAEFDTLTDCSENSLHRAKES